MAFEKSTDTALSLVIGAVAAYVVFRKVATVTSDIYVAAKTAAREGIDAAVRTAVDPLAEKDPTIAQHVESAILTAIPGIGTVYTINAVYQWAKRNAQEMYSALVTGQNYELTAFDPGVGDSW